MFKENHKSRLVIRDLLNGRNGNDEHFQTYFELYSLFQHRKDQQKILAFFAYFIENSQLYYKYAKKIK